jgi:hypothetical protein
MAVDEEILHEGPMPEAVIYISEFQNKLAWKFGLSVSTTFFDEPPVTPKSYLSVTLR